MGPERKLYQNLKRNTPSIQWNRIENYALPGCPDLLGYNTSGHFFTVELKVTKGNRIRFSPHQIAFHKSPPKNTFILVEALGQRSSKHVQGTCSMYRGSSIESLLREGLKLEAWSLGLEACCLKLSKLGSRTGAY